MANHVRTNVRFVNINEQGLAKLKSLYERVRTEDHNRWFGDLWVAPGGDITYEETDSRDWYIDNVGPKWCYFEDYEDDYFTTESAWTYPEDGIVWLVAQIAKAQPNIVAEVRYEDEMPNFFGGAVITADGVYDEFEIDYDEMRQDIMNNNEEIAAEWDAEIEEFTETGTDLFYDVMYEHISEVQDNMLTESVNDAIKEMSTISDDK